MNMNHLVCFKKVCDEKQITNAAEKLFITQQAVSKSIANLEKELDCILFIRNTKGLTLTPEAKQLYNEIKLLVDLYEEKMAILPNLFFLKNNPLQIGIANGVFGTLGTTKILPFLNSFDTLKKFEMPDILCEEQLITGKLDYAFSLRPYKYPSLSFIPMACECLNVIININHPLSSHSSLTFSDLQNMPFIILTDDFQFHDKTISACHDAGFEPKIECVSPQIISIYDLIAQNAGIFIGITSLKSSLDSSKMRVIPLSDFTAYWEVGLLFNPQRKLHRMHQHFLSFSNDYTASK